MHLAQSKMTWTTQRSAALQADPDSKHKSKKQVLLTECLQTLLGVNTLESTSTCSARAWSLTIVGALF